MTFDDDAARYYLMNARSELFGITLPYAVAQDCWLRDHPGRPLSRNNLRAWIAASVLRFIPLMRGRLWVAGVPVGEDDERIVVEPVSPTSRLYKTALADRRMRLGRSEGPADAGFAPDVYHLFAYELDEAADEPDVFPASSATLH